ncbi:MAG: hypothetical protein AAGB01_00285 [Cyanobacteria bacterium P01_F01_bin.42]
MIDSTGSSFCNHPAHSWEHFQILRSEKTDIRIKANPLLALVCLGLSYSLVGWYCAAFGPFWHAASWLIAMVATFALLWGWSLATRLLLLSPRILVLILALSMTLTVAASFSTLFIVTIILLSSTLFARLELQSAGVGRVWTLIIISIVSGATMGGGWFVGRNFYQTQPRLISHAVATQVLHRTEAIAQPISIGTGAF